MDGEHRMTPLTARVRECSVQSEDFPTPTKSSATAMQTLGRLERVPRSVRRKLSHLPSNVIVSAAFKVQGKDRNTFFKSK
jgi:hypothetical protein